MPKSCLGNALTGEEELSSALQVFDPPIQTPEFSISAIWHPRLDTDPAHRWLRYIVISLCRAAYPPTR